MCKHRLPSPNTTISLLIPRFCLSHDPLTLCRHQPLPCCSNPLSTGHLQPGLFSFPQAVLQHLAPVSRPQKIDQLSGRPSRIFRQCCLYLTHANPNRIYPTLPRITTYQCPVNPEMTYRCPANGSSPPSRRMFVVLNSPLLTLAPHRNQCNTH